MGTKDPAPLPGTISARSRFIGACPRGTTGSAQPTMPSLAPEPDDKDAAFTLMELDAL
jgi:hypothetical protein